jgi:hypothetical protein
VTPAGIGAARVGLTAADLRRVAGAFPAPTGGGCSYVRPAGVPSGVSIMLAAGLVARVDVDSGTVRTEAGASIGDSEARIGELYPGRITTTPHKYVQGARYLTVTPTAARDSSHRIVFETEGGRVARYRAGRVPEVEWVERCG